MTPETSTAPTDAQRGQASARPTRAAQKHHDYKITITESLRIQGIAAPWLKAGVEVIRVAEWAGHSVAVLMRVYAKFIDGGEQTARTRVEEALRG